MPESSPEYDIIHELTTFLDGMEALAPTRGGTTKDVISYRPVELDEIFDDTLSIEEEIRDDSSIEISLTQPPPPISNFEIVPSVPVVAVDCGTVRLGETENGVVLALRASIV